MSKVIHLTGLAMLTLGLVAVALAARAQVSALPSDVQAKMAAVGPTWSGPSQSENVQTMYQVFAPILKAAPREGVEITKNLAYGSDPKQVLDVYQPKGKTGSPVVIFIHGGAYVGGDKEGGSNITTWFARQGILGINANYPLAPAARWPAGAENVRRVVAWTKANAGKYGGAANRIYLIGHSAGATHVASYVFDKSVQPVDGPGVSAAVLISGRYRIGYDPRDPNAKNIQMYFGEDASAYPARSAITHAKESSVPVFIVICEYDNYNLDVQGAELLATLCERDGKCPRFTRLEKHNHISEVASFNTADEQLGRQILEFMKQGR